MKNKFTIVLGVAFVLGLAASFWSAKNQDSVIATEAAEQQASTPEITPAPVINERDLQFLNALKTYCGPAEGSTDELKRFKKEGDSQRWITGTNDYMDSLFVWFSSGKIRGIIYAPNFDNNESNLKYFTSCFEDAGPISKHTDEYSYVSLMDDEDQSYGFSRKLTFKNGKAEAQTEQVFKEGKPIEAKPVDLAEKFPSTVLFKSVAELTSLLPPK